MNRILVIDDDKAVLNYFRILLTQTRLFEVEILHDSRKAYQKLDSGDFELVLLDMDMPDVSGMDVLQYIREHHPEIEVVVITGVEDVPLAVESMKIGAYDYLCKPVDSHRLLNTIECALERSRLRVDVVKLHRERNRRGLKHNCLFEDILSQDIEFFRVLSKAEQIARGDNNVMIWGESGTGKDLVARAIHRISSRSARPFIAVNAAEFVSEVFASEFFGHVKGAYTGATKDKQGFFEEADGGVLFLDEIGELDLSVQSKLLRVFQSGEFFRLGSTQQRGADVRIIAATNKDPDVLLDQQKFRRDLFYRLNINSIFLPPLRERKGDVKLLAYYYLEKYSKKNDKPIYRISDDVMSLLERYSYPGNIRELENIIAGAVVLEIKGALTKNSLPPYLLKGQRLHEVSIPGGQKTMAEVEAEHICAILSGNGYAF